MGIGVGLDVPAAYSFIVEYTALTHKWRTANRYLVFLYYAQLFSYGSAILFFLAGAGPNLWRWVVGIGALPALILVVVRYLYMQESLFWLASREASTPPPKSPGSTPVSTTPAATALNSWPCAWRRSTAPAPLSPRWRDFGSIRCSAG